MEYGKQTTIYFEMIFGVTQGIMEPMLKKDNEESQRVMMNSILGLDGPKSMERNISPLEYFISNKLFRPMSEILSTLEAIENIAIYARSFPYKRQGVSRATYLKYHVENYLNELYLLKNRLIAYLKIIEKSYKKSDISEDVATTISPLYKVVSEALKGYIEVRGAHVHKHRYSDDEFDRLSTLELLSRGKDKFGVIMSNLYNTAYGEIRKKWVDKIKADITEVDYLLEFYFEHLLRAISKDGKLLFPNKLRKV
ncbi:MAG TPA: hypothetical protein VMW10_05440 [Alphaproteobacteria bacterium]|nr:hypothetical protein [Alphaproteobacteria bacterium]